jgi:hypothetical protein
MIQIIPSDHHPVMEPLTGKVIGEVKGVAGVKPAKPVQERTLPPLVLQQHVQPEYTPGTSEQPERRHLALVQEERRTYCPPARYGRTAFIIRAASAQPERNRHGVAY